jgi:hypothetical protein
MAQMNTSPRRSATPQPAALRSALRAALPAALGLAFLTACGGPGGPSAPEDTGRTPLPGESTSAPAPAPSPAPTPGSVPTQGIGNAELSIVFKASPSATAESFTLVCKDGVPVSGTQHPKPDAACAALKANPSIVIRSPRPTDIACTMQYGGPQTATVSGAVDGRGFESMFSLTDGCEISAWEAARDVLGSQGGAP